MRGEPESFAVVISDMRMPQMRGSDFLRAARLVAPDAVRMLLTGHSDLEDAIRAVNGARLFRFLTKPCDSQELLRACAAALGQHRLQTAERVLLEETLRGSVEALAEVLALTNPAAFGRAGRVKALAGKLARTAGLSNWWEVEVAATLAHIGAVTLPQATAEKLYAGAPLNGDEAAMVARVPLITRQLLSKIPRLEGVLEILNKYKDELGDQTNESPSPVPAGARVLRIAVDYVRARVWRRRQQRRARDDAKPNPLRPGVDRRVRHRHWGRRGVVREVRVGELVAGMSLADDVRSVRGDLLVARGQNVTERLIERLANLSTGFVYEPLRVFGAASHP